MQDLGIAIGLVLVLEGAMYALFPSQMIEALKRLPELPPQSLRLMGLASIAIGWLLVKVLRS